MMEQRQHNQNFPLSLSRFRADFDGSAHANGARLAESNVRVDLQVPSKCVLSQSNVLAYIIEDVEPVRGLRHYYTRLRFY